MKLPFTLLYAAFALIISSLLTPARAQPTYSRDLGELALGIYQQANSPGALERMRKDLIKAPEAYLVSIDQPGVLVLPNKRRVRVPAMKYNVALRLLEVRDSTGSHVWPPGSLDGFYMGKGADTRHFRTFLVRNSGTERNFVEVLTADDNAFLVLAVLHHYVHDDAVLDPVLRTEVRPARTEIGQVVVAGPSVTPQEPLRAISLNRKEVTRLFGTRAPQVEAYAAKEHLSYTDLAQVLRMVEYYNLQGK
ncbi:hypothetical protein ACFST9_20055 [Hymenobacter monticola]|uniref:Uncharacterized protein n=1 Tax=Hymenobacter monticola TaxID=1705399 RepID=A0ABY4BD67_9BACT|nr:hypothetical protein [Hymenobacter monticola]UOE34600.1 hypothetical protein MTP16_02855 [Hymenobacter monticola]